MKEKLLRVDQTAEKLNVSKRLVYNLISDCKVQGVKIEGCLRVTKSSVDLLIRRQIMKFQKENGMPDVD